MQRRMLGLFAAAVAVAFSVSVSAQKTTQVHKGTGGSPHVRSEWTVNGANISIEYGRPFLKGRTIGRRSRRTARSGARARTKPRRSRPTNLFIGSSGYLVVELTNFNDQMTQ